jgi:hypothetical protein
MSKTDSTPLVVRLSGAQRALVDELVEKTGKSLNATVQAALAAHVKSRLAKDWPASVDHRARKTPRPKPPVVKIPKREPLEHLEWFLSRLVRAKNHPEQMSLDAWSELYTVYEKRIKASFAADVSRCWHLIETHADLDQFKGVLATLPANSLEHRMLRAIWMYDQVRDEWSPQWRSLYGGVDRSQMSPARLEKVRGGDAKRKRNERKRKAAEKAATRAAFTAEHVSGVDNDVSVDLDAVTESGFPPAPADGNEEAA